MDGSSEPRIALVHDWSRACGRREMPGSDVPALARPLYTLLHKSGSVTPIIKNRPIHASFFRFLPKVERYYRYLLPLMPLAARWKLPPCDLVISLRLRRQCFVRRRERRICAIASRRCDMRGTCSEPISLDDSADC